MSRWANMHSMRRALGPLFRGGKAAAGKCLIAGRVAGTDTAQTRHIPAGRFAPLIDAALVHSAAARFGQRLLLSASALHPDLRE